MKKQSLIIIGAGAAGLMAAKELSKKFTITILEAQPRTGGRVHSIVKDNDIIEAGAEFIHGKLPVTFKLIKEAGLKKTAVSGKVYRNINGKLKKEEMSFDGWNEPMKKMKTLENDMPLSRFLDLYFSSEEFANFRSMICNYAAGFDLASPGDVSVKSLYNEWSAEEEQNYRVFGGYASLVDHLVKEASCTILTDKAVTEVKWAKNDVTISTANESFKANKVLVTVPVSILKPATEGLSKINFIPAINDYLEAASNIGFGSVIKVIIKFKKSFWQGDARFFFSDNEYFPTWWTQSPSSIPVLTGWCGGPKATNISHETKDELLLKAILSLGLIFNRDSAQLQQEIVYAEVCAWQQNGFAGGGYSYETIYSETAKALLATPLHGSVFFAGEALYTGKFPGTVEAALQSGIDAAERILKS